MLLDILRVASRWEMLAARRWAIHHLQLIWLPPARQIELAVTFGIPRWIKPAFSDLVRIYWRQMLNNEARNLDSKVFITLGCVKEAIARERTMLALNVPKISSTGTHGCPNHAKCSIAWKETWFKRVTLTMLHPDQPLQCNKVEEFIRGLPFFGMTPACRDREFDIIFKSQEPFQIEERLIAQGATTLESWCRDQSSQVGICCGNSFSSMLITCIHY